MPAGAVPDNSRTFQTAGNSPSPRHRLHRLGAAYYADDSARGLHCFIRRGDRSGLNGRRPTTERSALLFPQGAAMSPDEQAPAANPQREEQNPGLPVLVLEIRARLGANASPEHVAAEVRATGYPNISDDDVRQLWDEGHLPK